MGCGTCSSGGCSTAGKKTASGVSGCKSNGGCATGGCNKMNVFDWLGNMDLPSDQAFDTIEIRFKNGRKEYYQKDVQLELYTGDPVIVEANNGYHLGHVSLQGDLVRLQMRKRKITDKDVGKILRLATEKDLEKYQRTQERNLPTMFRTRQIIRDMKLKMKLSDVEFQADNAKATFYYSADDRVDFRELIKVLAAEFKIRVEMKQISLRQEASRLGGIGSCGRELCCSTWLTEFKSVSTSAARYQNLALNPGKLSGQCGRLKCCLNYELETYMDALKGIPNIDNALETKKGILYLHKTDIFKGIMWFGYKGETVWHPIPVERVLEIIDMNKQGELPDSLEENVAKKPTSLGMSMLGEFEQRENRSNKKRRKRSNNRKNKAEGTNQRNAQSQAKKTDKPAAQHKGKNNQNRKRRPRQNQQNNQNNNPKQ